ncbi:RCC1/BLIP-II protein [Cylindrobasidium torrendii FP15055 ss-10]|uniref:RCC1/BLIP-II protein n=1 Tax=Cylindrobasidium torrendii FP15055 ss-10 TaxID=1314674 RepID=A0A0D7BGZ4_9AGAR|nr:RCC1/BLIP-II protein [Cylindrobasidium torrendii FP15055 ss-10]
MSTDAPRRSARAAAKPAAPPPAPKPKAKAAAPKSKTAATKPKSKKRASPDAEEEDEHSTKRSKSEDSEEAPAPKPKAKKEPPAKKPAPVHVQTKPYLNPLPSPPEHQRPGLQLFAWGAGNFGQFGMGPDVLCEIDKPKKHPWAEEQMTKGTFGSEGAGLESAAAGGMHSLFIDEAGTVWSCGLNDDAALGRDTAQVPDPEKPDAFLDVDELTAWPHPLQSLKDENFRAVQVVAGDSICAAVSAEGELRVWGSFRVNEGSLGFASGLRHQFQPVPINLELSHKPGDAEKVASLASGGNHVIVLTTHGNIYSWGAGEQAQLGRRVLERRKIHGTVPEKVTLGTRGRKGKIVGAGMYHSFAVDHDGEVWGWGLNTMGQLGTGHTSENDSVVQLPKKVTGLSPKELGGASVVQIAGGEHHSLFLTSNGKVYACGRSNAGQLGLPADAMKNAPNDDFLPEPIHVPFPDDEEDDPVVYISVGTHNNLAVTSDGAMYCWGQGTQGELGVPDVEVRTPRVVVRREGGSWAAVQVACGGQHTLGLFRKK